LIKINKLKPELLVTNGPDGVACECREVRKIIGGSLLDPDDRVLSVLKDGEFIQIGIHIYFSCDDHVICSSQMRFAIE
jgi:hypothetical protein